MAKISARRATLEISEIVRGMNAEEVLSYVKTYIRAKQNLSTKEEVFAYWGSLTENAKVDLVNRALS